MLLLVTSCSAVRAQYDSPFHDYSASYRRDYYDWDHMRDSVRMDSAHPVQRYSTAQHLTSAAGLHTHSSDLHAPRSHGLNYDDFLQDSQDPVDLCIEVCVLNTALIDIRFEAQFFKYGSLKCTFCSLSK
eukprot:GEMP01085310.1.p1 GENE.GEMP01085310.1~~GEMP01085310.1.p1  ORF type:complete len:129 (+),score=11.03 GEMP01085310.1:350-736(+)